MNKNKYSTPLLMLATILAGMLSPMQSAVNGQLGHWLQDGNACAVISFASGLVVMFFIIIARKETRQQFASIPALIKTRKIPLWNWFAGLCGAMVVFSEGASASALGVATFQTALISALLLSGLLCDRFGVGVDEKKYFTPWRVTGALFAVIATVFVVSPQWHSTSFILLAILPFLAGLLAGWQPAGNAKVAEATGSMLVSITWNFIVGFCVLGAALAIRVTLGHVTVQLPDTWWMYLGGPLGLLSIGLMAILVRGLGLLMLGVASTAGQLLGSVLIDELIPSLGNTVYLVTIIGTLFALVGAIVTTIPEYRASKMAQKMEVSG
ncbi:TPA: DMT family transporter [Citrobacter freundii]|uniref:DMT family transporter n=1 Tax=Citrobacter freundii TaxID=546 RepID=UPI0015E9264D|nr:DMT family transporter [Citrobacter freundii]QMN56732.1 DMT family transporter [Citrobacter freundii]HAU4283606.1 DMT family transporter [Citrobacter freundii]HEE0088592.1 DMT family transporter [Citrobacter freundii]HEJ0095796.1 DMT family transporter [Citrobacter freundii]HEQ3520377.1 DMT family transporter [Citrobacter freundii]